MTRLQPNEALSLFTDAPLQKLRERAEEMRFCKHPLHNVTFVLNTHPKYTNICDIGCSFCSFCRNKAAADAYHKSPEQVMKDIGRANASGLTTVLLQGGLHEKVGIEYLVELVRMTKQLFPAIQPHFFSAPEIHYAAQRSKITVRQALQKLYEAGQRTIPGGGAEILSSRVHQRISPCKLTPQGWLEVHKTAHEIGFRTTATMMYGHVETPEDIVEHLTCLRTLQDETKGFLSFIPWSCKSEKTLLGKRTTTPSSAEEYLRIIAFSRIFLDNFDHITASRVGEDKMMDVQALHCGADDFAGTIREDAFHRASGHVNSATVGAIIEMITKAGFVPFERDALYNQVYGHQNREEWFPACANFSLTSEYKEDH